jgi:hypothetical protein
LSQFQTPSAPARGPRSERTFEIERSIVRKGCKSFCALVKMLRRESIGRSATTDAPKGTGPNKSLDPTLGSLRRGSPEGFETKPQCRGVLDARGRDHMRAFRARPVPDHRLLGGSSRTRFRVSWKIRIERSRLRRRPNSREDVVTPFRPFQCTIGLTKLELPFRLGASQR